MGGWQHSLIQQNLFFFFNSYKQGRGNNMEHIFITVAAKFCRQIQQNKKTLPNEVKVESSQS